MVEMLISRTVLPFIERGVYYLEFRNGQVQEWASCFPGKPQAAQAPAVRL